MLRSRPALLTVLTFAALICAGTLLLLGVGFDGGGQPTLMDAAFTAVSAVCVTGLSVVDLSQDMDFTGQLLVLILLQIGGLGVLTFSNWILLALRQRLGMSGSIVTRETYGGIPRIPPSRILARIMLFTFIAEGLGAVLLYLRFVVDEAPGRALWLAVFHSVSAFCNAGFSLFSDSLVTYRGDAIVNLVVMGLIITGGLGFVAAVDIMEWLRERIRGDRRRLGFHTHVVLITSGVLILFGGAVFLVFEWGNTIAHESLSQGILESLFLSVTARTAGFNTVGTGHLTNMTLLILMLLMMIGASPGSTGGGVKTTTFAIVWARVRCHISNRTNTEMLGRTVARQITAKAMAMVLLYALTAMLAMVALQATEYGELPHDQTRGAFLEQLFEVISALSTVGLSTGLTTRLSNAGLGVLMVCMFIGRIGPLVLAASLIGERKRLPFAAPEGDIMVG